MKLVVEEPESAALAEYVEESGLRLATSRVAIVEIARAVRVANASIQAQANVRHLLDASVLVDAGRSLLHAAAAIASERLRTLDAIHLATIQLVDPYEVLVYDGRLRDAVVDAGYMVTSPA